jgi:hypothetical protein
VANGVRRAGRRDRLKDALFRVADHEAPHIRALPQAFEHYRYELRATRL